MRQASQLLGMDIDDNNVVDLNIHAGNYLSYSSF
jgi:hypothetical protein